MTTSGFILLVLITAWRSLEEEKKASDAQVIIHVISVGAGVLCLEWFGDALASWAGDSLTLQMMTYSLIFVAGFCSCRLCLRTAN